MKDTRQKDELRGMNRKAEGRRTKDEKGKPEGLRATTKAFAFLKPGRLVEGDLRLVLVEKHPGEGVKAGQLTREGAGAVGNRLKSCLALAECLSTSGDGRGEGMRA